MKEKALQFGDQRRLCGILTLPDRADPARPPILIPNTGIEHRVGPSRLHVEWARAFAAAGFVVLRFDLSGMGDSRMPGGGASADSVNDQRAALDELQRLGHGRGRFIVVGLCSGGNDGHLLTLADDRIIAGVYMDHYTYPTPRFKRKYWKQRFGDPLRLARYLVRRFQMRKLSEKEQFRGDLVDYFTQPSRERFSEDLNRFVARKVALMFVYTGELQHHYNYTDQFYDWHPQLRGNPGVEVHYLARSDHTFTRVRMRRQLSDLMLGWLEKVVAAQPPV